MSSTPSTDHRFRIAFVLLLVAAISALFFALIAPFLKALLIAAILSGLCHPLFRGMKRVFRGHATPASIGTIVLLFLIIVGPLTGFLGVVAKQAVDISNAATPWIKEVIQKGQVIDLEAWTRANAPFLEDFIPSEEQITNAVGGLASKAGNFLVANASRMTAGTASFFLELFVMLYAMFFFLIDGEKILGRIFYFMPLDHKDEMFMLERFTSITRATIKGSLVIGVIQGTLGGLGLAVAGIQGAAFWGTVMVILSIIPALGTALVWIPACVYLYVNGEYVAGTLLLAWSAGVVGTVDNVLRPRLVGQDAEMPDLLILVGTLGGIALFGIIGFIVGPVVCGLFLAVWDIYGETFKSTLPQVGKIERNPRPEPAVGPSGGGARADGEEAGDADGASDPS